MRNIITLAFLFATIQSQAQEFDVKKINDSLLKNANAVKRTEEYKVKIYSANNVLIDHKWAITIMNEEGKKFAVYNSSYSKMEKIPDVSGTLYDASGKELKSLKRKDIIDHAAFDGITLASDERALYFDFGYTQYPYTVEFEEEQKLTQSFSLPHWLPVESGNFSVQKSKFVVEAPVGYKLRYEEFNLNSKPTIQSNKFDSYEWTLNDKAAIQHEVYSPSFFSIVPSVFIAPSEFKVDNYLGTMNSWKEFGQFIKSLNKDRDILPEQVKTEVHTLTDLLKDPHEKVRVLYQYLQNSTHYVLINFGIGGWQPYDATYVGTKKYGDCKALSNYMVALLKEAGIKSNYVLISAGSEPREINNDFPMNQFNHAIACVPMQKDTMWLECTSQTVSPGFMGSFTGNRKAILIDDEGGYVVHTPAYKAEDNVALRKVNASIDENGNLKAEVNTTYTGEQQEDVHSLMHQMSKDEKEKLLNRVIGIGTYTIEKSTYKEVRSTIPSIDEHLEMSAPDYAAVSGKRLFIVPNIINKSNQKLPDYKERNFPICVKTPYIDIDTVIIKLPAGYMAESMPSDIHLKTKFGTYNVTYKVDQNSINLVRYFCPVVATFPAADYVDFAEFYNKIYKMDRNKMILVKKES